MVNIKSPTFKFSEKIGVIVSKGIRYILVGGIIVFIGGILGGSKPSNPVPNSPPPPLPSPYNLFLN